MKIFVTGGTGFIGSYVIKELSDQGHAVTILARNPDKVPALYDLPGVEIVKGDLGSYETIVQNVVNKDACIHIALGWGDDALNMLKNDTLSSVYMFEAASKLQCKQFIYTSSTAVIGDFPSHINLETPTRPIDFYGATKASSESFLNAISHQSSMSCTVIRPGYTFGNPVVTGGYTQPDRRFHVIAESAKNNRDIVVTKNDGTQFIWAGDLAKVYSAVLTTDNAQNNVYFGLGTEFITWERIAHEAVKQCGSTGKIIVEDAGIGDVPSQFDVSSLEKDFGFSFNGWEQIVEHVKYLLG